MVQNLKQFIAALEAKGELTRVSVEVDPALEITEIADRLSKAHGPAVLFERVKGSDFPVLINAFGSNGRMEMVFDDRPVDEVAARIETYLKTKPPEGIAGKIKTLFTLKELADTGPAVARRRYCTDTVHQHVA